MRSLLVSVAALLLALVVGSSPASAQDSAYPPRFLIVTVSDGSPEPEAPFDVTVTGCVGNEVIEFEFGHDTAALPCAFPNAIIGPAGDSGAATQQFAAPAEGGIFSGTVSLASTNATIGTFQIIVEKAPLSTPIRGALVDEPVWSPDFFTLLLLALAAIAVAVIIRLRLLNE